MFAADIGQFLSTILILQTRVGAIRQLPETSKFVCTEVVSSKKDFRTTEDFLVIGYVLYILLQM